MSFSSKLLSWYAENGRNLPWRRIDNPYYIWLSEIILQQTRIEQGREYYLRFIEEYPTVADLAAADEQQVLKTWQGLGYYSRARHLHESARSIMNQWGGVFPSTYNDILSLSGVGRYTAAAIASFAFKLPYPVIDGNVYRFISRIYGICTPIGTDKAYREFEALLLRLIDTKHPDLFNQAIMDFGSLYCKPTGCDCEKCIFRDSCVAHKEGKVALLPVKPQTVRVVKRYFYYYYITWNEGNRLFTLVQKREQDDIWKNLYEFPLLETSMHLIPKKLREESCRFIAELCGSDFDIQEISDPVIHKLTHRTIEAVFVKVKLAAPPSLRNRKVLRLSVEETKSLPISRLIDNYLLKCE